MNLKPLVLIFSISCSYSGFAAEVKEPLSGLKDCQGAETCEHALIPQDGNNGEEFKSLDAESNNTESIDRHNFVCQYDFVGNRLVPDYCLRNE